MFQVVSDRNRANRAHSHRLTQRVMAAACITATVWIIHCTASYASDASSSGTLAPVPRNLPKDQDALLASKVTSFARREASHLSKAGGKGHAVIEKAWSQMLTPQALAKAQSPKSIDALAKLVAMVGPHLTSKQATQLAKGMMDDWVYRPIAARPKGLTTQQVTGEPQRLIQRLTLKDADLIFQALEAMPIKTNDKQAALIRATLASHGWPAALKASGRRRAVRMIESLARAQGLIHSLKLGSSKPITAQKLRSLEIETLLVGNIPKNEAGLQYYMESVAYFDFNLPPLSQHVAFQALTNQWFKGDTADPSMTAAAFHCALTAADDLGLPSRRRMSIVCRWIRQSKTLDQANTYDLSSLLYLVQHVVQHAKVVSTLPLARSLSEARHRLLTIIAKRVAGLGNLHARRSDDVELMHLIGQTLSSTNLKAHNAIAKSLHATLSSDRVAAHLMDQVPFSVRALSLSKTRLPSLRSHLMAAWVLDGTGWQKAAGLSYVLSVLASRKTDETQSAVRKLISASRGNPVLYANTVANAPKALKRLGPTYQSSFAADMKKAAKSEQTLPMKFFIDMAKIRDASKSKTDPCHHLFADTLETYLNHGGVIAGEFKAFKQLGHLASTAGAVPSLRQDLAAPDGSARLDVSKTLAWAYDGDKAKIVDWRQYLKTRASNQGLSGDQRATWYLALSYAAQLPPAAFEQDPGLQWIQKAFVTATSASLRMQCLQKIVHEQIHLHHMAQAKQLLASARRQFQQDGYKKTIASLQQSLENTHQQIVATRQRVAAMRRAQVRSVLAARLKAARASGDTENIQRYQRLLTDLDGKASSHHGDQ